MNGCAYRTDRRRALGLWVVSLCFWSGTSACGAASQSTVQDARDSAIVFVDDAPECADLASVRAEVEAWYDVSMEEFDTDQFSTHQYTGIELGRRLRVIADSSSDVLVEVCARYEMGSILLYLAEANRERPMPEFDDPAEEMVYARRLEEMLLSVEEQAIDAWSKLHEKAEEAGVANDCVAEGTRRLNLLLGSEEYPVFW